ncbi:site-specific integrase [Holdemanella biformis]|jgi:integrase|nr:site-specific integrase [Holdemanella biformis]MBU9896464.1 site-specific integrase [Holdemanella biformis]MBV3417760.1 site-specific integrase [Holdemanella biformis]MBV4130111.1 site-specific integrase [Holdemanella biformis]MBV4149857.1 site-specific integrase [Holdemanella biformis]MCC3354487.1 site-specific integrase [Holdemanella biformis]
MVKEKTINQITEEWKEEKKKYVKKSTYAAYQLLIQNHIKPYFGDLYEVNEEKVQQFVFDKLDAGLSEKTIRDIIIVLKMILKFGIKNGYLEYIQIDAKFPSKQEKKDLDVLSKADQKKFMEHLRNNFTFKNLGIFICLSTGMRIGEICGLRWCDVDTVEGVIKVRHTLQRIYIIEGETRHTELLLDTPKTANSVRDIPMSSELLKMLKSLNKVVNENYYVISNDIKPIEPRTYRNYYKKLCKQLDIPELKFHGLRHSFATRCIESKADYKTVSVLLGHSNISTTLNLYVHPNKEQKKKTIDKMLRSL